MGEKKQMDEKQVGYKKKKKIGWEQRLFWLNKSIVKAGRNILLKLFFLHELKLFDMWKK